MADKRVLFHQISNGKWKYKCVCGNTGNDQWFDNKREAELAHAIHWVGCKENK